MLSKLLSYVPDASCLTADADMYVSKPFNDILAYRGKAAVFTAQVIGCHKQHEIYRNGEEVPSCVRHKLIIRGNRHTLIIRNVSSRDEGVYLVICKNTKKNESVFTRATLHIREADPVCMHAPRISDYKSELDTFRVLKNLVSIHNIIEGDTIRLKAEFSHRGHLYLFKNKTIICELDQERFINWHIQTCQLADSGIYECVLFTKYGALSSKCSIVVLPRILRYEIVRPDFVNILPSKKIINLGQPIFLISRCVFQENITALWTFNANEIHEDHRTLKQDHGEGYLSLTIRETTASDVGWYSLAIKDETNQTIYKTACEIIIKNVEVEIPSIRVRDPTPIFTHVGSQCVLSAEFHIDDVWQYYAKWHIGQQVIRADDENFKLRSIQDTYILGINCIQPEHYGRVTCTLYSLASDCTVQVAAAISYITVVPAAVNEEFCHNYQLNWRTGPIFPTGREIPLMVNLKPKTCVTECYVDRELLKQAKDTVMICYFIRMEANFHYLKIVHSDKLTCDNITVKYKSYKRNDSAVCNIFIYWIAPISHFYTLDQSTVIEPNAERVKWRSSGTVSRYPGVKIRNIELNRFILCRLLPTVPKNEFLEKRFTVNLLEIHVPEERSEDQCLAPFTRITREEYHKEFIALESRGNIGRGGFGQIKVIQRKKDEKLFVKKETLDHSESKRQMMNEINTYKLIKHTNIAHASYYIADDDPIIILEYLLGASLQARIDSCDLTEMEVKEYVRQICAALAYLHSKNIVHLDIKPDNIMMVHPNLDNVKLVDFGGSMVVRDSSKRLQSGTDGYVAPEAYTFPVGPPYDMWAVGATTYQLLTAKLTFLFDEVEFLRKPLRIFDNPKLNDISEEAKNFVGKLFSKDTRKRLTANEALAHEWLSGKATSRNELAWRNRMQAISDVFSCCDNASCTNHGTISEGLSACGESICSRLTLMHQNYLTRASLLAHAAAELDPHSQAATNQKQKEILNKYFPRPSTSAYHEFIELKDIPRQEGTSNRVQTETPILNRYDEEPSTSQAQRSIFHKCTPRPSASQTVQLNDLTRTKVKSEMKARIEETERSEYSEDPSKTIVVINNKLYHVFEKCRPRPCTSRNPELIKLIKNKKMRRKQVIKDQSQSQESLLDRHREGSSSSDTDSSIP